MLGRLITTWQGVVRRRARARRAARRDREPAGRAAGRRRSSRPRSCRRASRATTRRISMRLTAAGEVVWGGLEPLGERDGRLALYLTDHLARLAPASRLADLPHARARDPRPSRTERRIVLRAPCTTPRAAAIPAKPSMRSGRSCGKARSRTTRSTPCARSRVRPNAAAARRRSRAGRGRVSAAAGSRRRPPKGAGRSSSDRIGAAGVATTESVDRARAAAARRATAC